MDVLTPDDLRDRNPNAVGGDPYGGSAELDQSLLWRPLAGWSPSESSPVQAVAAQSLRSLISMRSFAAGSEQLESFGRGNRSLFHDLVNVEPAPGSNPSARFGTNRFRRTRSETRPLLKLRSGCIMVKFRTNIIRPISSFPRRR